MAKRTFWLSAAILMCLGGIINTAAATATEKVYQQQSDGNSEIYSWEGQNLTNSSGYDGQPAVSPDGTKVAFVSNRAGGNRLFVMSLNGAGVHQLTTRDSGYPAWSPDGRRLAYASSGYLHVIDADGGNDHQVGNSWSVSHPTWSAYGQMIAYAFYAGSNSDIYSVSATAANTTPGQRLTTDASYDQSPSWTPTGKIVFQSNRFGATDNLFAINEDGSAVSQITQNTAGTAAILPTIGRNGLIYFLSNQRVGEEAVGYRMNVISLMGNDTLRLSNTPVEFIGVQSANSPFGNDVSYAALGDSVASGEGANEGWLWRDGLWSGGGESSWESDPLSSDQQHCHQSQWSYKYTVRATRGVGGANFGDYSCSGASVNNGLLQPQTFRDGSRANSSQVEAMFGDGAPTVITLTIGANDVGFSDFLAKCYKPLASRCDSFKNSLEQLLRLRLQRQALESAVSSLISRGRVAGVVPHIYLTGYFDPFLDSQPVCSDTRLFATASLTRSEVSWLRQGLRLLNRNIKAVANKHPEAIYIDTMTTMSGHGFCSTDPWVYGPSILLLSPGSGAPYHPTPAGQAALARRVLEGMA
ncbi:hypothetical protein EPO04_01555 [Patescibacteria group bacterium]|nr:MAG: hypothetical protein EPO04_01555 [Patescibacteria group bacterium]